MSDLSSRCMQESPAAAVKCYSSTSCDGAQSALYQPLDTVTTDYTSMYTTPTGRPAVPDSIKKDADTIYDTVMEDPYYI